jgi:hypothetical protein
MEDRMVSVGHRGARLGVLACIAVLAALAAAGCTGSTETPPIIYITPPPGPGTPGPMPTIDSFVISTDAPDRRWKVTFKKPVVSGIPDATAGKINAAIAAKVNAYIDAFTGGSLPAVASGSAPSTLDGDFTIALLSPTLLSLRFSLLSDVAGAASAVGKAGSINFVTTSGAQINLKDIFSDPTAALPTLATLAHTSLATQLGVELTWSGQATSISFFDAAWAMTTEGLEFTWTQGEIASSAAGKPSAVLTWPSIKSIVNPSSPAGEFVQ